jgi:hypothetical protein
MSVEFLVAAIHRRHLRSEERRVRFEQRAIHLICT